MPTIILSKEECSFIASALRQLVSLMETTAPISLAARMTRAESAASRLEAAAKSG